MCSVEKEIKASAKQLLDKLNSDEKINYKEIEPANSFQWAMKCLKIDPDKDFINSLTPQQKDKIREILNNKLALEKEIK